MVTLEEATSAQRAGWRLWLIGLLPIVALALMLAIFAFGNPLAMFRADLPPVESLNIERIAVTPAGFASEPDQRRRRAGYTGSGDGG